MTVSALLYLSTMMLTLYDSSETRYIFSFLTWLITYSYKIKLKTCFCMFLVFVQAVEQKTKNTLSKVLSVKFWD